MERICREISVILAKELNYDEEKRQIIQYGIFGILQIVIAICLIIIGGLIFGLIIEGLIIMITSSSLRKYCGGVHASTPIRCLVIGTIICLFQAFIVTVIDKYKLSNLVVLIVSTLIWWMSYFMIKKYVPVDNPKKLIKSKEKKLRMKRGAYKVITIYLTITIILLIANSIVINGTHKYIYCIFSGIIWQMFTLTKVGHQVMLYIDNLFGILFNKKGEYHEKN